MPRLIVHERYENGIKWSTRFLLLISILLSVVVFPAWYYALGFSIFVTIVQQFFERAVFRYTTIYVQPFPTFMVDVKQWTGVGYAFPEPESAHLNVCGPSFQNAAYARVFFDLMRRWNGNEEEDAANNICLSFIIESPVHYSVLIYPNMEGESVKAFFRHAERRLKYEKYGRLHDRLVVMFTFVRTLKLGEGSLAMRFFQEQSSKRPYWFQPFLLRPQGDLSILYEVAPILKQHLKVRRREDLVEKDFEFGFQAQGNKPRPRPTIKP